MYLLASCAAACIHHENCSTILCNGIMMAHGRQHAAVRIGRTFLRAPRPCESSRVMVVPNPLEHHSFDDTMAAPDEIPSRPSTAASITASLFSGNPVVIFAPQVIAGSNLNVLPRPNALVQDNLRRAQSAGAILSQRKLLSQSPPTRPQSGRRPRGSTVSQHALSVVEASPTGFHRGFQAGLIPTSWRPMPKGPARTGRSRLLKPTDSLLAPSLAHVRTSPMPVVQQFPGQPRTQNAGAELVGQRLRHSEAKEVEVTGQPQGDVANMLEAVLMSPEIMPAMSPSISERFELARESLLEQQRLLCDSLAVIRVAKLTDKTAKASLCISNGSQTTPTAACVQEQASRQACQRHKPRPHSGGQKCGLVRLSGGG